MVVMPYLYWKFTVVRIHLARHRHGAQAEGSERQAGPGTKLRMAHVGEEGRSALGKHTHTQSRAGSTQGGGWRRQHVPASRSSEYAHQGSTRHESIHQSANIDEHRSSTRKATSSRLPCRHLERLAKRRLGLLRSLRSRGPNGCVRDLHKAEGANSSAEGRTVV